MQKYLRDSLSIRSLIHLVMLAAVWLVLSEGISGSWLVGLPVIVLVVIVIAADEEEGGHLPVSPAGCLAFLPFFLWQSVVSGFDVALRALRPNMGLMPVLLPYQMGLPDGAPRRLFINSITLMPGTLSVKVQGDTVLVHVLDEKQPVTVALQHLEARVGAVFGVTRKVGESS